MEIKTMGTWNGTCAISQLPILTGDSAVLVLLVQSLYPDISENEGRDMLCGANTLWTPRAIPIRGKYDGYGRIKPEDPEHWTVQLALARFQLDLLELEEGTRNPVQEPAVRLGEVLQGSSGTHWKPMSGIEWVQHLIQKDRLRVKVPAWLDDEEDRTKAISSCLIRSDIYDFLAELLTDDNYGGGRRAEFTQKQVRDSLSSTKSRKHPRSDPSIQAFLAPRTPGHATKLMQRTRDLLGDDYDDDMTKSMESMTIERLREHADKFALDYGAHLLSAGVGFDEPTIESIITEIAAFTHVSLHLGLLNKFWHPQPNGGEGWLSHMGLAMKTLELAKRYIREEDE